MKQIIYAAFAALILTLAVTAYSDGIESDLENNIVRLHIIANSDSAEDQEIKLRVRDAILSEVDCSVLAPKDAAILAARTAERVLAKNGFAYGAHGEFTKMYFPVRIYKDCAFPAGEYRAVRIILGDGGGKNWWCVLYPPVCMSDPDSTTVSDEARQLLRDNLDKETFELIFSDMDIRFRSVELAEKAVRRLRSKF